MGRYRDEEEIDFKLSLITHCIAELYEHISPNYKSRSYELLIMNFSANEVKLIDKYFTECLRSNYTPTLEEFRQKIIEITNGFPFNKESAVRLLVAYQHEELFLKIVDGILKS